MKFNISLVSLMHAVNNQCQIKISFQPCFFHWLLETKSHRYLSLLCSIHHSNNFLPCIFTKAISKKVMKIYDVSRMKLLCSVHICSPPSCCSCLNSSPSPMNLATWWMGSPLFRFLPRPLESFHAPAERKRPVSTADQENQQVQTGSWARREEKRENEKQCRKALAQTQSRRHAHTPSTAAVGWPYTKLGVYMSTNTNTMV